MVTVSSGPKVPGSVLVVVLATIMLFGVLVSASPAHADVTAPTQPAATQMFVACDPSSVEVGTSTTCTATVTGESSVAGQMVSWGNPGTGTFDSYSSECTLVASPDASSDACSVTYTPLQVGAGSHSITANYLGDATHLSSTNSFSLTVTGGSTSTTTTTITTTTSEVLVVFEVNPDGAGSTTPSGSVSYAVGSSISISASANSGYVFSGWSVSDASAIALAGPSLASTTATVNDFGTVTANFGPTTVQPADTQTDVACSPDSVAAGSNTTCTATVTSSVPVTGQTVSWSAEGSGTFDSTSCMLDGNSASCSVVYTPTDVGSGVHVMIANYKADADHLDSSGRFSLTVTGSTSSTTTTTTTTTSSTTTTSNHAAIWTDLPNYAPGDTPTIYGSGFKSNASITVSVTRPDDSVNTWFVISGDFGNFTTTYALDGITGTYTVTATDSSGQTAQTTFADDAPHNVYFATSSLPNGVSVSVTYSGTDNGGNSISGTRTFNSPDPSSKIGTKAGTQFTFSFPSSVTSGSNTYNFVSASPPSSPACSSQPCSFTTGAAGGTTTVTATYTPAVTLPGTPILISPGDGAYSNDNTPTFTWDSVTGATDYQLQYSQASDFTGATTVTQSGLTATSFTVPDSSPLADAVWYWHVRAHNSAGYGSYSSSRSLIIDTTSPVLTPTATVSGGGSYTADTWTNKAVTVAWGCTDSGGSGVASGPTPASETFSTDGTHTASSSCTDLAGNTASTPTFGPIKIDTHAPTITYVSRTPAANANGWNNVSVTVSWSCSDGLSGPVSGSVSQTVSTEGDNQQATGTCTDMAGNSNSATVSDIKIDLTPPTITGSRLPLANANGWNNESVTVSFTCGDVLSGVASCSPDATLSSEGAGQSATGTVVDMAGNSNSATVSDIKIDLTPPSVTLIPDRAANAAGWYNALVTFTVSSPGSDLSGVVSCDAAIPYSGPDSATASVTGHCTDAAGNVGSGSASFKYDATAPTITISSPVNGAQYVLNAAVPSGYECSDTISGMQSCSGTVANGLNFDTSSVSAHSFTVSATDRAGNTATPVKVTYNVIYSQSKGRTVLPPLEQVDNPSKLKKSHQTGSTIPIKFQLFDSKGVPIGTAKPTLQIFDAKGTAVPVKASGSSNVGNVFRYDPTEQQYIYNLSTKGLSPGVYRILITLGDGSPPIVTYFQLK